jgi:hypothetical protein
MPLISCFWRSEESVPLSDLKMIKIKRLCADNAKTNELREGPKGRRVALTVPRAWRCSGDVTAAVSQRRKTPYGDYGEEGERKETG